MLPSHRKALRDITVCRTEVLGGQVFRCEACDRYDYSYHSCCNRHCPKCQNNKAADWLVAQSALLLPVLHFLVTVTLPDSLRRAARRHQKLIYGLMFRCAAKVIQKLSRDPKFIGGEVGLIAILQTLRLRSGQALDTGFALPPACAFRRPGRRFLTRR